MKRAPIIQAETCCRKIIHHTQKELWQAATLLTSVYKSEYFINPTVLLRPNCGAHIMSRLKPTHTLQPLDSTGWPNRLTWNKTVHRDQHIKRHENVLVQVTTSHEASRITQGRHKSSEPKAAGPAGSELTYKISTVGCVKTFDQLQEPICIRHNGTIMRIKYVAFRSSTFTWVTDMSRADENQQKPTTIFFKPLNCCYMFPILVAHHLVEHSLLL